jgi:DNA polymerase III alpha subunit
VIRVRSGFSFREAAGSIDDVLSRLVEIGAKEAPITDRASTFGFYRWDKAAKKLGLRPVFGVELAVTPSLNEKKPAFDHTTFIAKDSVAPLNRLVETATTQFRYRPLLTVEQALTADGVFKILGHRAAIDRYAGVADTFLALGPSTSMGLARRAIELGIPFIASSDNRYPRESDRGFYEVLTGRNAETQTYPQHILSDLEWLGSVDRLKLPVETLSDALRNAENVRAGSTAILTQAKLLAPPRPATLYDMCVEGAEALGIDLLDQTYAARLDRELSLIEAKAFEDYFYIVADLCQYARSEMIVGPARGSSCGSLVCYLLRITTIDPIPYGLIFERFIDVNRSDLPDIDVDFSDQQRYKIFDYLKAKYGTERVARLGTVAMFKPRSALQECGAALRVPRFKTDAVGESLVSRPDGDARALKILEDTFDGIPAGKALIETHPEMRVATRFEGHPRHAGQHAAGVVIAERPVIEIVAIDRRTGATMCDKRDAEDGYGLLKIDALGLTQLSVFERALELMGIGREQALGFLDALPLDDPAAYQILNDEKWSGIFQFNGAALQGITKQFEASRFEDVVTITALGRPGPMMSGGTQAWIDRRNGTSPVTYPHPMFEPLLAETLGVLVYQEQVMAIGREVGGLSWADVTALRKLMAKTMGQEALGKYAEPWKAGAIENGLDPLVADKVWNDLVTFGQYGFNKSHSVAYGLVSYWCLWLKAHHPFEFAAATLSFEPDPDKQIKMLREMRDEGIEYVPVDAETSTELWEVGSKDGRRVLVGPLSGVKGIGPKMIGDILGRRARRERLTDRQAKLLSDPKTAIDSLWPIRDAFARIMPDPAARNIHTAPTQIGTITIEDKDRTVLVFCVLAKITVSNENAPDKVERREGRVYDGPITALNLHLADDTGTIFAKISRYDYEELGQPVINRGRVGKALYAVKGVIWGADDFKMISVKAIRYIGDVGDDVEFLVQGGE